MEPKKTGAAYDQITDLWTRDSFDRSNGIEQHKRAISFAKAKGKALDVGCGCTGRFIDLLLNVGFQVEGVDISSQMIELARERHPDLIFHHADVCEWELPQQYDFITAWDSIWHVPLDQHEFVLRKLLEGLKSGGVLIFSCGGVDEPGEKRDSNMGPEVYYSVLGIPRTLEIISDSDCVCRHLEYDQYPELHTYIIAQKRQSS